MRGLAAAVVAAVLVAGSSDAQSPPRPSPRTELILLTGFESGVYHPVGRDIRRLLDERGPELGIELAVVPSRGALQNVVDVFRHPSIQLGLTQADVLSYLEIYARGDPEARRILGGLQVVVPLFDEDVYLFARPEIKEIGDLAGKRIGIGPAGSGTTVTALVLLHLAGVEPRELVNIEFGEAADALRRGRIDAAFGVFGTPSALVAEAVPARPVGRRIQPLSIRLKPRPEDMALAQHYRPSTIPAGTYPWQERAIDTVKVTSLLVTAGAPLGSPACEGIGHLALLVTKNLDWLKRHGQPTWKDVRPDSAAILADPRVSPCVVKAFRQ